MTAEIALLNRSALAFAADSAVTIRIGTSQKIYDSAEKIFELSRNQPIALMIYNNVEFVGVPLDVLIRKYRNETASKFDTIGAAADHFIAYLSAFKRSERHEDQYLFNLLFDAFSDIHQRVLRDFEEVAKHPPQNIGPRDFIAAALIKHLEKAISLETRRPLEGYLQDITEELFIERYKEIIRFATKEAISAFVPSGDATKLLYKYAFALVKSSRQSNGLTGFVFGGFGTSDLFPTLVYSEIDGVFHDSIKIISKKTVDIDRENNRAQMLPFAQKEMADRFIFGLDNAFQGNYALDLASRLG